MSPFPAYEWQGNGADGDHNVFFKSYDSRMKMPLTYRELVEQLRDVECYGIPHHTGYMPGHRGKNWATHDEAFSPVTEIYSSHGCSESSDCSIPLNVHIHMGPRTEQGTALYAHQAGHQGRLHCLGRQPHLPRHCRQRLFRRGGGPVRAG